jgi:alkanesulfonate monooxygenase SsuD/methylene tetrahydromethanopterin reductase-like flavin-dependent oxidoreductase (luciferase family)
MKYGITIPRTGMAEHPSPLKYLTTFAREAEQVGYAYAVVGDRLEGGIDPLSILTAIVEASGRMRLTTSVLVLPPRGVLVAAKQYASLDVLSGGRVIAGVGTGSLFRDYEVAGMDHGDMWPRFEEAVRAMRAYLTPGAAPFQGRFYDTHGVNLEPKAVQKPSLPIWIGSWGSNAGLRRVARLADGWLSSAGPGHQSPEQFAEDVKRLNAFLVREGKDPATFPHAVSTMALFISEDRAELARLGGPGYVPRPAGVGVSQPAHRPLEDAHAHDMVGTRAECLDKVRRWKAAGVQALFLVPRGPEPLGQMRLFMDGVASKA